MQDALHKNTPTHWACLSRNYSVITLLVNRAPSNLGMANGNREIPLDIVDRFAEQCKKDKKMAMALNKRVYEKLEDASPAAASRRTRNPVAKLLRNRNLRLAMMAVSPFVIFLATGLILNCALDYLIKLGLFIVVYIAMSLLGDYIFDERIPMLLPLCIYFGTKAWYFILWFGIIQYYVSPLVTFIFISVSMVLWYNFIKTWRGDAGKIKTTDDERYRTIIQMAERDGFDHRIFCTSCLIRKPLRSKHCAVCDVCVAKFDHHCPWVGNCVGANNHKYFMGYLFSLIVGAGVTMYGCYSVWLNGCSHSGEGGSFGAFKELATCHTWVAFLLCNTIVHAFWVVPLTACQLYQIVFLAMTTNERMNAGRYKHFHQHGEKHGHGHGHGHGAIKSPFDKGCWRNARDFAGWRLGGLCRPTKEDWAKIFSLGGRDDDAESGLLANEFV